MPKKTSGDFCDLHCRAGVCTWVTMVGAFVPATRGAAGFPQPWAGVPTPRTRPLECIIGFLKKPFLSVHRLRSRRWRLLVLLASLRASVHQSISASVGHVTYENKF